MGTERLQPRLIVLSVITLICVGVAALNIQNERNFAAPSDGISWAPSAEGVQAQSIESGTPAAVAGIQPGDVLVRLDGAPVRDAEDVAKQLYTSGIGSQAYYELRRGGSTLEVQLNVTNQPRPATVRAFLRLAAIFYLLLGIFILWRRIQARRAAHFYLYCISSFVLLFFSYTGEFNPSDWAVYWMSVAAMLLQPALFAHFCLSYGELHGKEMRKWLTTIYASAGMLALLHAGVALGYLRLAAPLGETRWLLDRTELAYLASMYAAGITWLGVRYHKATSRLVAKQAGWLLGSAVAGLGPFVLFYAIPYAMGKAPTQWMNVSALSLPLLPFGMAYAIARYRLLDVEVVLRRGMAYTLATAALVGSYLAAVALAGDFFHQNFPAAGTAGLVLAVVATGLLFQPIQRWVQAQVDRYFLRKNYDYGEELLRFGRQLSTGTNLNQTINSLLERLASTLQLSRAALFIRTGSEDQSFALCACTGFELRRLEDELNLGFLCLLDGTAPEPYRDRLFFAGWETEEIDQEFSTASLQDPAEGPSWEETIRTLQLSYYFGCRAPNHLTAVLALGRTTKGDLLSDEDESLVETLAGYVGAAIENVTLFDSLTTKAKEYEDLQQFSENILESINVGLMAVGLDDRVQSVNTPLELMYPLPFRQCRGRLLDELFPPELMALIDRSRQDASIQTLYRHRVRLDGGQEKVLDIAVAPLLSKNCEWIGRLIIFDDVTGRVALESQLRQAEKLSSIGLLAAGVAHEINTPLTVISTQAQMLAKQLAPEDKNFGAVEKIIRQTFRASEIVNSLLNFSRTKGAAFTAVDLNQIMRETLLLLEHPLKTGGVELQAHLEPGLPLVHGNSDQLQQVFLNLFLNAKDAMQHGGELRITSWAEDSRVRVEIRDNGAGIAPEHLPHIYDPFFTTKGPGRGTGLGLAVSYGIIREHAGRIHAESRPGFGTRFELEFPVLRKPVHA